VKLGPRAKFLLIAGCFALPMVASSIVYYLRSAEPTGNYGALLLPPARITTQPFAKIGDGSWRFEELKGRWIMTSSDSGACPPACRQKLLLMRQVQLALGRNASRVARVYVVDDLARPDEQMLASLDGAVVALTPTGLQLPLGAGNDRAHIYLVDPNGNVMLRWPAQAEPKRMLKDLERLLKASQIG
jgi:hypothetical protein